MAKPRKKPKLPRGKWTRSPAQKPHSTEKGAKGYSRRASKRGLREETEDTPR